MTTIILISDIKRKQIAHFTENRLKTVKKAVSSVFEMINKMIILIAIVTFTVLAELLAIIVIVGKEWEKLEVQVNVSGIVKEVLWTYGLWEYCRDSKCKSIKKFYEFRKESVRGRFLHLGEIRHRFILLFLTMSYTLKIKKLFTGRRIFFPCSVKLYILLILLNK